MQPIGLANTVRQFRNDRAWTQEHLALAANLASRTVQRVEETGQCSQESLMALASAFGIDVAVLTRHNPISSEPRPEPDYRPLGQSRIGRLFAKLLMRSAPDNKRIAWTLAAMFPSVYFITANVLNFVLGVPWLYVPMEALLQRPIVDALFEIFAPYVLLGGLGWALAANLSAMLEMQFVLDKGTFRGSLVFKPRLASGMIFGASGLYLGILLLYLVLENLNPA